MTPECAAHASLATHDVFHQARHCSKKNLSVLYIIVLWQFLTVIGI